jgi:hypothetical protein
MIPYNARTMLYVKESFHPACLKKKPCTPKEKKIGDVDKKTTHLLVIRHGPPPPPSAEFPPEFPPS